MEQREDVQLVHPLPQTRQTLLLVQPLLQTVAQPVAGNGAGRDDGWGGGARGEARAARAALAPVFAQFGTAQAATRGQVRGAFHLKFIDNLKMK